MEEWFGNGTTCVVDQDGRLVAQVWPQSHLPVAESLAILRQRQAAIVALPQLIAVAHLAITMIDPENQPPQFIVEEALEQIRSILARLEEAP